jgi:uncharacterized protein HemY
MQGEMHVVRDLAEQVERIWEDSPDAAVAATSTALAMVAGAFSISGDIARAAVYLRRAAELPPSSNMTAELHGAAFHAQSLGWAERYSEARHQLTTLLDAARRLGSPTILAFALAISAEIGWWSGQWATAYADATEALQWDTRKHRQIELTADTAHLSFKFHSEKRIIPSGHVSQITASEALEYWYVSR